MTTAAGTELPWWQGVLPVLDFETTGVDPFEARPVAVSLILTTPKGHTLPGSYSTIIDPGVEVPAETAEIHGITTERAREEGVQPESAMWRVLDVIYATRALGWPLVGYNIGTYDWPLLLAEYERANPDGFCGAPPEDIVLVDPLVLDRHVDKYRKGGRKLETVARHYGCWREGAHDAFTDACMTADVLRAIYERHPELQETPLTEMMAFQEQAHTSWAVNMNDYFARKGREDRIETGPWPLSREVLAT